MIYTSYFGNIRNLVYNHGFKSSDMFSISQYDSKFVQAYNLKTIEELKPGLSLLWLYKGGVYNWKEYAEAYYNKCYDIEWVFWRDFLENYDEKVLLCYEKDFKHCHRYLVGKFLEFWNCKKNLFKEV